MMITLSDHLIIISSELPTLFLSGYDKLGDNFEQDKLAVGSRPST